MSARKILIIDGHPDPDRGRFVHALADAYATAARGAGHDVQVLAIADLEFPLLRRPSDWETGSPPKGIAGAQQQIAWADHLVLIYPLWLGDVPALLKGFLEQVLRPHFAFVHRDSGLPQKLLKGRSARVVVTMGMPALFYRWVFSMHSLKSLERNILKFVGIAPVQHTLLGRVDDAAHRENALAEMQRLGAAGD
jgi:putative NADPH-quinone reductase